ncbi:MAG: hypothetical protein WAW11_00335 [Patescibacteria group bacterium]
MVLLTLSFTSVATLIIAIILIAIVWVIKATTCHLYYYFAFDPERNIPVKVAWIATVVIISISGIIIW